MQYQFIPYVLLLIISGLVTLVLGVYTLSKRRNAKGAISFSIAMFIVTLWSIPNALEMSSTALESKLFWANTQYMAYSFSPVVLFVLCLEFSGFEKLVKFNKLFWILIIPILTIFLVWTDEYHGLIRNNIHMDFSGAFPVIKKQYGPFFYLHALHSHILNLSTIFILIRAVFIRKTIYRKQVVTLLIGVSLIVIPNLLYITGLSVVKSYDITPVFFGPAGLIMAWSFFRYRMFDLVYLARASVIEDMDAGVVVLDLQDRILDINPAFADIIGLPKDQIIPQYAEKVCIGMPNLIDAILDRTVTRSEFIIMKSDKAVIYEALLSVLKDKHGYDIGRLVVIYDITEKKTREEEYLKSQWKLAVKNERKRMVSDLHDNLGQVLGFINLYAQAIQKELEDSGERDIIAKLDKLIEEARVAHQQLRDYIHDVRNSDLIELNFIAALDKEITNYELQTAIKVCKIITPEFSKAAIAPGIRINILNIIKEAMNNVRKHAHAINVKVSCDCVENIIVVSVHDDGSGFETVHMENDFEQGFGLDIMKERAVEMGGFLDIESKPGEGSAVILRVPLDWGEHR